MLTMIEGYQQQGCLDWMEWMGFEFEWDGIKWDGIKLLH
jgi:hypothetical protein